MSPLMLVLLIVVLLLLLFGGGGYNYGGYNGGLGGLGIVENRFGALIHHAPVMIPNHDFFVSQP